MKNMILLIPAVTLLMTGCGSVVSESPLYTDENVIQDPGLVGAWHASKGDGILVVQKSEDNGYRVLHTTMGNSSNMVFDVHLVQLKDIRLVDIVHDTEGWTIPAHSFAKVSRNGHTLKIAFFDSDLLKGNIVAERPSAASSERNGLLILRGSTPSLQQLLLKHVNDPGAFGDESEFQRIGEPIAGAQ